MKYELKRWKEKYTAQLQSVSGNVNTDKMADDIFVLPFSEDGAASFINARLCCDDEKEFSRAIIIDDKLCGGIHLAINSGVYAHSAHVTFWVSAEYEHNGVMTNALREFIDEVYKRYEGIIRISAYPFADNTAARCVLNNCGFELECTMKKAAVLSGVTHDVCIYTILR